MASRASARFQSRDHEVEVGGVWEPRLQRSLLKTLLLTQRRGEMR